MHSFFGMKPSRRPFIHAVHTAIFGAILCFMGGLPSDFVHAKPSSPARVERRLAKKKAVDAQKIAKAQQDAAKQADQQKTATSPAPQSEIPTTTYTDPTTGRTIQLGFSPGDQTKLEKQSPQALRSPKTMEEMRKSLELHTPGICARGRCFLFRSGDQR